jgi:putative ABC transport system permease protein
MMGRVHGKRFRGVLLGLPVEQKAAWSSLPLVEGRLCEGPDEAILAAETAKSLGAVPGDRLIILARRGPRPVTLVGTARSASLGDYAPGATLAMPMATVEKLFNLDGNVDRLRLFVDEDAKRSDVLAAVAARLPDTLVAQAPAGQIEQIDNTLRPLELALRFAGALSIAMAVFLILNSLRMNFSERRSDMAIVRVLGATTTQVLGLHIGEGICIGLLGATAGIPLSILLARGLEHALGLMLNVSIPAHEFSLVTIATAVVLGPVVATIAAVLPALQSRRISAIEALCENDMRPAEHIPLWAVIAGAFAWCVAVSVLFLVVTKRLPPAAAISAPLRLATHAVSGH